MTTIEDDSAPLLPHELNALIAPPPLPTASLPHRPKRLPPKLTSTVGKTPPQPQAVVSPAAPALLHPHLGPPSPLEPFPAFDPKVGPSEDSPYYYSPVVHCDDSNPHPVAPEKRCCANHDGVHLADCNLDIRSGVVTTPPLSVAAALLAPRGDEPDSHFLKLLIRCHTLFTLAERLLLPTTTPSANKRALSYLHEAKRVLASLEKQSKRKLSGCDCTPQQRWQQQKLIEFSADNLRERLEALEERGFAERERSEEANQNEKTARLTAWLKEL